MGFLIVALAAITLNSCNVHNRPVIAIIPQTDGSVLWDGVHVGGDIAARKYNFELYWNAPTREDDVEAQIALVNKVASGGYSGLVLAPDQALAMVSPVRRALSNGIPTVIISSPIPVPAGENLSYIINDDEMGGRLAADRVAQQLHGHGSVALLGMNPDITGTMTRARAFAYQIVRKYPEIQIVDKRIGSFNVSRERQVTEDALAEHPHLDAIVDLMWSTADGTLSYLDSVPNNHAIVVAFDSGGIPPFNQRIHLDSVIQSNTTKMGELAVEMLHTRLQGQPMPAPVSLPPTLITRENIDTELTHALFPTDWQFGNWRWSPIQ